MKIELTLLNPNRLLGFEPVEGEKYLARISRSDWWFLCLIRYRNGLWFGLDDDEMQNEIHGALIEIDWLIPVGWMQDCDIRQLINKGLPGGE